MAKRSVQKGGVRVVISSDPWKASVYVGRRKLIDDWSPTAEMSEPMTSFILDWLPSGIRKALTQQITKAVRELEKRAK